MANLSSAIIEARKRHEAEIAERLKRRQQRQRAEIERLNTAAVSGLTPAPSVAETPGETVSERPAPESEPRAATAAEPLQRSQEATPAPQSPVPPVDEPTAASPRPARPQRVERIRPVTASSPPRLQPAVEPPYVPTPVASLEPPPATARIAPQVERLFAQEAFDVPARADEVETPPDGRFLKLRNEIIDRVKPFLTGNQFAVYLEIYRQTIGRGRPGAWFRTREIQAACNLGSDNTVRDAYPVLEQKRLIKLDANRRAGSPKGLFITVLSVERALERLERAAAPVQSVQAVQASAPEPLLTAPVEALAPADTSLVETLTRTYGVSPTVAPQLLEQLGDDDASLLPYMLARLERTVATGKVHNPAGLLRVWIESFDSWRPELEADRQRDEEAKRLAREALSRDELMLEWFRDTEAEAARRYAALDPAQRAELERRGRDEMLARSPAVRTWTEQQWAHQLEIYVKAELRRELDGFDAWLARRRDG